MTPIRQFRWAVALLFILLVVGTVGYTFIVPTNLFEGFYMTVITLATVGYREIFKPDNLPAKVFTAGLILVGAGALAWAVRSAAEIAVGDHLRDLLGRRRLEQQIAHLEEHTILCGYGRMGRFVASELVEAGVPFIVVERDANVVQRLREEGIAFVQGDATDEGVLIKARIRDAKNLVSMATQDADNVLIVLTARGLNPDLRIVARSTAQIQEEKFRRAGADDVVSPYALGGRRLADAVIKPDVMNFLDIALGRDVSALDIASVTVGEESDLIGKTLADINLPQRHGVAVVAIQRGTVIGSAPEPDVILHAGDILFLVGTRTQVQALKALE